MRALLIRLAAPALLAMGAMGCDPKGTCLVPDAKDGLGPRCAVDHHKSSCEQDKGTFTKEEAAAGRLRCTAMGYEFGTLGGQPSDLAYKKK